MRLHTGHAAGSGLAACRAPIVARGVSVASEDALDVLRRLRAGGVAISIDDFGAGHSSLARLRSLDVDEPFELPANRPYGVGTLA